jgi:hypothetical protein
MITNMMKLCSLVCLLFAGACLRKANGEADDDGADTARLHETCEAWCQVAVPCSDNYAQIWSFSTQAECEHACVVDAEHKAAEFAVCLDIVLDVRECAAALACEDFKQYENWAFGEPNFSPSCVEEHQAAMSDCNF